MSVSITAVRPATADEWDLTWAECDYSTYFHSREWAEIWNAYTKGKIRPDPKLVVFADGKKALLPISSQKSWGGMLTNYVSSPAGTFGGWISNDELNVAHAVLLSDYLVKKVGNLVWRLNPYDKVVFEAGVRTTQDDETHTVNLEGGFDAIFKRWTEGNRSTARKARKARREGVSVKIASKLYDWLGYYQVYEDSLRRWGNKASSRYSWKIFDEMFKRNSPGIKLWLAFYQDKVVAGALCFYARKHVVYWHGAGLKDYFHLRPVNLIMYEAIKDACEQEYVWFDFNPSGGHEGVKAFKKSFGAEPMQCPVVTTETALLKFIRKIRCLLNAGTVLRLLR